ncbi:hypothetical protein C8039_08305 [Halogeometricum sp. wsp3]|nr:hypothetical protein C8039_08305 [Halogeometricum sp. wsp3]
MRPPTPPRPTSWRRVEMSPTIVDVPLTQSTVYAHPRRVRRGVTPVKELSQEDARDDRAGFQQVNCDRQPNAGPANSRVPIERRAYDEFTATELTNSKLRAGSSPTKRR